MGRVEAGGVGPEPVGRELHGAHSSGSFPTGQNRQPMTSFTAVPDPRDRVVLESVGRKDSTTNVEATGEFVLNIATQDLLERLNLTAANFPSEEDEFAWAGLSHVASDLVRPPRVGEAPVSFETRLVEVVPVGNCFLVLGEVVRVHVATDVWRDGRVDPQLLRPVLRLAGSMFARLGPTFNLARPTYDDVLGGRVAQLPEELR
jgi:flavin reductase (DIM6/NTAB) family NADH-FMN oxidoreductase RutF